MSATDVSLPYDAFNNQIEAHFEYALDLAPAAAAEIFERRLDDGSWLRCPALWAQRVMALGCRGELVVRRVVAKAAREIVKHPVEPLGHEVLVALMEQRHGWTPDEAARIATWFVADSGPGEASLAADILGRVYAARRELVAPLTPIAGWLVQHGAAELRSRRRLQLTVQLVEAILESGDHDLLRPAVRYVLANEERLQNLGGLDERSCYRALLLALDQLLASDSASPEIVADLARRFDEQEGGRRLGQLAGRADLPALRMAAVQTLLQGLVMGRSARTAWSTLFLSEPFEQTRFANRDAVLDALHAFIYHVTFGPAADGKTSPNTDAAWATSLASELLRLGNQAGNLDAEDAELLARCNRGASALGIRAALREHVRNHQPQADIVPALLQDPEGAHGSVRAAIRLLAVPSMKRTRGSTEVLEQEVKQHVDAILAHKPTHRYSEIRELLAPCNRLIWDELDSDDKARIDGEFLRADKESLRTLLDAGLIEDELVAAGVLYVVHEVVHLCQRIGDKTRVTQLRDTGAETTLMHVDLGADHVAAVVSAEAIPPWSLRMLKDVQGRSTAAFPTGPFHTTAARSRKAQRLVGLRLDLITRDAGVLGIDADEYVFAEYGPAGGHFVVMRSGPPWGLIGVAPLSRGDAERLYTAAEPRSSLVEVDAVLREAVSRMRPL